MVSNEIFLVKLFLATGTFMSAWGRKRRMRRRRRRRRQRRRWGEGYCSMDTQLGEQNDQPSVDALLDTVIAEPVAAVGDAGLLHTRHTYRTLEVFIHG